jgi:acyl-CoA thioester hydrolase
MAYEVRVSIRERCSSIPSDAFPFSAAVQTRYADVDSLRHINNVAIAQILSEGRYLFFANLFRLTPRPTRMRFVVGEVAIRYMREAFYPADVQVGCGVLAIQRSSLRMSQGFFSDGRCTSISEVVMVAVKDRQSFPFPAEVRAALEDFLLDAKAFPPLLSDS